MKLDIYVIFFGNVLLYLMDETTDKTNKLKR